MKQGKVFWLTGLSGAGKTAIATGAKNLLEREGVHVSLLDGDTVRRQYPKPLGFSPREIVENNRRIIVMCREKRALYDVVFVSVISPFEESRELARKGIGKAFHLIYVAASEETLIKRDTKGLYQKYKEGKIGNLVGFSAECRYEIPKHPDLIINTSNRGETLEKSVSRFFQFVKMKLFSDKFPEKESICE